MTRKISGVLRLFEGQTLFGSCEEGSRQLFLSTVKLNPYVNYFRIYLEDIRGSLAKITGILEGSNVNILSGGAFSLGNIWISEFTLDFKGADASPEDVINEIEGRGGYVTSREITELFPRSFDLQSTFEISGSESDGMYLLLPGDFSSRCGLVWESASYAVLKAWPRVKALSVSFYPPEARLIRISAKIQDVPGSLHALADAIRTQVDLQTIDELHHDAVSGEWGGFGVMVIGGLEGLREKARGLPTVIEFEAEPLGWKG
ncbi:MAG: hypothetical protein ACE5OO_01850 [Candidatus Bathyarchaeia archaeon]